MPMSMSSLRTYCGDPPRQDAQSQYTDGGVDLIAKTPATSSTSITYDFADDELLRDQCES